METHDVSPVAARTAVENMNYWALIRAYKIIREFKKTDPDNTNADLIAKYEEWRNDNLNLREKDIAEMVVFEEMLYGFFFRDKIEAMLGFALTPGDEDFDEK